MTLSTKKIPLYIQIIIGLVFGLGYSIFATFQGWIHLLKTGSHLLAKFYQFFKIIAVPLVLVSLIVGIASMNKLEHWGKWVENLFLYIFLQQLLL